MSKLLLNLSAIFFLIASGASFAQGQGDDKAAVSASAATQAELVNVFFT